MPAGPSWRAALQACPSWSAGLPASSLWRDVALVVTVTLITGVIALPLSWYRTFVIEQRFGFNRMTFGLWALDLAKGALIAAILGIPLVTLVLWLMTQAGRAVSAIFSDPVTVTPVASPPQIGPFSYGGGTVTLVVSGGTPPYQLQIRADLTAGSWENLGATFTNTPITFPATNQGRNFYRVMGQ